jgi:hypothetical protein
MPLLPPLFFPLDEELELLPGALTPTLAESAARVGTEVPSFARAARLLEHFTGVRVSEATLRRRTEAAGAALVAVETADQDRLERELPPSPAGPDLLQASVDGALVPLVGGDWAEVRTLAVGRVEAPRSAPGDGAEGAREVRARELSYVSRLATAETFRRAVWPELFRRGIETARQVVWLADGSEWCHTLAVYHRADGVHILDFPHAVEYLAAAAEATFGARTLAGTDWLTRQCHDLKHGDPADVLAALLTLPTARARDPQAAAAAQATSFGYLAKRWDQIQYATFRAAGYPIGSGCVESANKLVVEARLKGPGMHWARSHVTPLAALRATLCSERWDATWPQIAAQHQHQIQERQLARRRARQSRQSARQSALPTPSPAASAASAASATVSPPPPAAPPGPRRRQPAGPGWRRSNSLFFAKRSA